MTRYGVIVVSLEWLVLVCGWVIVVLTILMAVLWMLEIRLPGFRWWILGLFVVALGLLLVDAIVMLAIQLATGKSPLSAIRTWVE